MFDSNILEIIIGLALTYALLGVICTGLTELVSTALSQRSKTLEKGIRNLLNEPGATAELTLDVYKHPLIKSLGIKKGFFFRRTGKPSYVPSKQFALALLDTLAPADDKRSLTLAEIRTAVVEKLDKKPDLKKLLLPLLDSAEGNIEKARKNVEEWFDDGMDRVSGLYKRNAKFVTLFFAILVTVVLNADTGTIANSISKDQTIREAVVAAAEGTELASLNAEGDTSIAEKIPGIDELGIPFGWNTIDDNFTAYTKDQKWYSKAVGWTVTILAVSLGAQFWFDALGRLMSMRSSGGRPTRRSDGEAVPSSG